MNDTNSNSPVMPDIQLIRARAFSEWKREYRQRLGVQERIGASVPWWLIIIATVFYLLSAPHTAATFNLLTPGWGWAAPVGVEMGTVYVAFRRYQLKGDKKRSPVSLEVFFVLVVFIAVLVNGAGSLSAVVDGVNLTALSLADIFRQFGTFPATTQVALILVPIASLVIPIGALVAGEGVAALILERRIRGDLIEQEWRRVSAEVEFRYLRDSAVQAGITPKVAATWASALVRELSVSKASNLPIPGHDGQLPDATVGQPLPLANGAAADEKQANGTAVHGNGQGYVRKPDAQELVRNYLDAHPESVSMSVRELAPLIGVGKSTVAQVLKTVRQSSNVDA